MEQRLIAESRGVPLFERYEHLLSQVQAAAAPEPPGTYTDYLAGLH